MKNQKGLTHIFLLMIIALVIIAFSSVGFYVLVKNRPGVITGESLGESITLGVGSTVSIKNNGDVINLKLNKIFITSCGTEPQDGIVHSVAPCKPQEAVEYDFKVNNITAKGSLTDGQQYSPDGSKLSYGVTVISYKFDKSAVFIIDTPIKSCEHLSKKIENASNTKLVYQSCVYEYAYSQKRVDWCQLLDSSSSGGKTRESCIEDVAMLKNDKTLCSKVGVAAKSYCAVEAIIAGKDIIKCDSLAGDYKYRCIQQIAKDDISQCNKYNISEFSVDYCNDLLKPGSVQY